MLKLVETQQTNKGPITLLSLNSKDGRGFGRIIRDSRGWIADIVNETEATPEQLQITELNAGVYAFDALWVWENLPKLTPKAKGELYLTDLIQVAAAQGLPVVGVECTDLDEVIGVNNRVQLAEAETAIRRRVARHWMTEGVTLLDPATAYIDEDARIEPDTVIYPNTHVLGQTIIGAECEIGPNSVIRNSKIGAHCRVKSSFVEESTLEDHVEIGPFGHLRSGAHLGAHVHMGNYGEVKNSRLGAYTRMGHFSYIGDSEIGEDVNIGAGVVTVNYDGERKHKTTIGDHAFIGSDSMLIAPLNVAQNARTAAGSVVTKDVPEGKIAVGVPARMRPITRPQQPTEPQQEQEAHKSP
jgi:bifunctional UDP-N-acetylglucosamine pyrophosphorylase/glucosamine-1-phosphate N-acetyltransferase